jgi:hypothetical protein
MRAIIFFQPEYIGLFCGRATDSKVIKREKHLGFKDSLSCKHPKETQNQEDPSEHMAFEECVLFISASFELCIRASPPQRLLSAPGMFLIKAPRPESL